MILRKSVYRTLNEKKFQYAGVTVLLVLSVMLYVSLSMAISTLEERNNTFSADYKQETFHFVTGEEVTEDQLSSWEKEYDVILEKRNSTDLTVDGATLRLFTETSEVNIPYISEGELPSQVGEVALSKVFAEKNGYNKGDSVTLGGLEAEVTGFVYLPDYIYMVEQMNDLLADAEKFGIGLASPNTFAQLDKQVQTEVLGWSDHEQIPNVFQESIGEEVSLLQFVKAEDNPRIGFVETEIEGAKSMNTTLPLFILALSIAMVLMLMKRHLEMQRKEIGTLMALGYRRNELQRHYLGYAWVIGLVGTLGGLIAGAGLSVPLSNIYANYFNLPALSFFDWNPMVLVIGLVIPLSLLMILTTFVIHRSLKTEPLTLLRPKEISAGKKSWLEKLPFFQKGGFIRRFRLRLMVRSKARSFYIFIGVMFSTILLLFGLITFNSMEELVETTYKDIQTYQYAVHYKSLQTDNTEDAVSPFTRNELSVEDNEVKINAFGIEKETEYIQLLAEGELLNPRLSEGVVISAPLATILGVGKGDSITLENSLNDDTITVEVAGIADLYIGNNLYMPREELNSFLGFPGDAYTGTFQEEAPTATEEIYMVEDKQKAIDSFESTTGATRASVAGMAVFAILIGVIVLTLLTNLIVEENSPSISLFKVMGYQDKEISKLVLSVYTPVVLLSYFISIPLASLSLEQTMNTLVKETGFLMPTDVAWWMAALGFGVIMLTYWLSLTLSKRKLKNVSLQEALKKQQD